ncbi:cyclase family protein [Lentzea sp. JNUCC 0626]|uniref:cyclase family protein n=1 Tax=Lentzea sp. JNUCC 0626 TaxID=3367513 RepID=UPI003748B300
MQATGQPATAEHPGTSEVSGTPWYAVFDIEITFPPRGRLRAEGFRIGITTDRIDRDAVARLFARQLGLTAVETAEVSNLRVVQARQEKPARPANDRRRLVELSQPIRDGMITYPGLPAPSICDHLSWEASRTAYGPGTEFQIGRIDMVSGTGTYLDTPAHRYRDGDDLAGVGLDRLADLPGVVLRATGLPTRAIDVELLHGLDIRGKAVLVETGWSRLFGTSAYGTGHPYLTAAAAEWLVAQGAVLVGIDSLNIDDDADPARPVHTALLGAGIPVVEHLRDLDRLPVGGFRFTATPPLVEGMGTFPVRAFAVVDA